MNQVKFLFAVLLSGAQLGWASTNEIAWVSRTLSATLQLEHQEVIHGLTNLSPWSLLYAKNTFVYFGLPGGIATSSDAITWTSRHYLPYFFGAATYANQQFIVVGSQAVIASSDGITWTESSVGVNAGVSGIAYGNGLFVAVGKSGSIALSVNASNWITFNAGSTNDLSAISFGQGKFVALQNPTYGFSGVVCSTNGITWTNYSLGIPYFSYGIAYGNSKFVVVGQAGMTFSSPDGVAWTSSPVGPQYDLTGVTYANEQFVAFGSGPGTLPGGGIILTSTDGSTWKRYPQPRIIRGVAYGNGKFLAIGDGIILESAPIPVQVPITMGPIRFLPNHTMQGTVTGNPRQDYLIQASTNLADWFPLTVLTGTTNAIIQFTDPSATNFTRRFYRAVSP